MLQPDWLGSAETAARSAMDRQVLDEIAAAPGFRLLMRPYVERWRVQQGDSAALSRTLRDLGCMLAGFWALYLHASPGGLTLARLAELLERSGVSSPGRARSLIALLLFLRYVQPGSSPHDRRLRVYVPTSRLLEALRARFQRDLNVMWPVDPAIHQLGPLVSQDGPFFAYMAALGEVTALSFRGYQPGPGSLDVFSRRFGGMTVLAELLLAADPAGPFPSLEPLPVTTAGLARTCHISRAQVRRMLADGERTGLLETLPSGAIRITRAMVEQLDLLMAGSLLICAFAARQAMAGAADPDTPRG